MSLSPGQIIKYKVNQKKWERAREARGLPYDDAALAALKMRKIGRACSSKEMNNGELDEMLGAFAAVVDPADLNGQMDIAAQKEKRAAMALARVNVVMLHLGLDAGHEANYVAGIARKVLGSDQYQSFDDVKLKRLEGVLVARVKQIHSAGRVAQIEAKAAAAAERMGAAHSPEQDEDVPF